MKKSVLSDLIGHVILDIQIGRQEDSVRFVCVNGDKIDFDTTSGCCSETWIAEVLNLPALIGKRVIAAIDLGLPERPDDGHSRQAHDIFYGFRLDTKAGSCTIVFRNSSNGFYGGTVQRGKLSEPGRSILGVTDWTAYEGSPRA